MTLTQIKISSFKFIISQITNKNTLKLKKSLNTEELLTERSQIECKNGALKRKYGF